ncbi:MAG: redox-regulated ATPase YchF [Candidatus Diapherotrites archaeon]|nr:redox-regulated ATPase YchF [Candidatus Diapherotrites archaeon]
MKIGLVGAPSSGKSSFFNAATLLNVPMAPHPFTTIEPNKGIGFVRVDCVDKELGVQCNPRTGYCRNGTRFVPVELVDVAGLVPDAHQGKGLGNKFLSDLSQADVLVHVVDASGTTNEEGQATQGHDPVRTVQFLENEINQWYLQVIQKNWPKFSRVPLESKAKLLNALAQNLSGIGGKETFIEKTLQKTGLMEKKLAEWTPAETEQFAFTLRAHALPILIAANKCDLGDAPQNIERMKQTFPQTPIIPCSAISELSLKRAAKEEALEYLPGDPAFREKKELSEQQKKGLAYIREQVLAKFGSTGIQSVLEEAVFRQLQFIAIYPGGTKKLADDQGRVLPDCLLMPPASTALDFAFKLHTDMGNGFIRAINVKTRQTIGKEYELKHRDVIEIVFKG